MTGRPKDVGYWTLLNFINAYELINEQERLFASALNKALPHQERVPQLLSDATKRLNQLRALKQYIGSHPKYAENLKTLEKRKTEEASARAAQEQRRINQQQVDNEAARIATASARIAALQSDADVRYKANQLKEVELEEYKNHDLCRRKEHQLRDQLASRDKSIDGQKSHIASLEKTLGKRRETLKSLEEQKETLERQKKTLEAQKDDLEQRHKNSGLRTTELETQKKSLQTELQTVKSNLERAQSARDNIAHNQHTMQGTIDQLQKDKEQLNARVQQLADTCRKFGQQTVNLKKSVRSVLPPLQSIHKDYKNREGFPDQILNTAIQQLEQAVKEDQ